MMKKMKLVFLTTAICGSMMLSGCSFRQVVNRFLDRSAKEAENVITTSSVTEKEPAMMIDDSLNKPVYDNDLTGAVTVVQGSALKLETAASVSDGGTVTYQWYSNNVNSNGGGTIISGATDPVYTVDTSEAQTTFYYVVATNTHDDAINMSVSGVYQVTVWPQGEWKETEGKSQYVIEDGTFPVSTRLLIDGTIYAIDAEGYATDSTGLAAPETMKGEKADAQVLQAEQEQKDAEATAKAAAEEEAKKKAEAQKKAEKKAKKKAKKEKKAAEEAKKAAEEQQAAENNQ